MIKLAPPLYLFESLTTCWKCAHSAPVFALACERPEEWNDEFEVYDCASGDEVGVLSHVVTLPGGLLDEILKLQPHYERRRSRSLDREYYANICPHCGALLGDHFLHSEPGDAFYPENDDAAEQIAIHHLAWTEPVELDAMCHIGPGSMMFESGQHVHST